MSYNATHLWHSQAFFLRKFGRNQISVHMSSDVFGQSMSASDAIVETILDTHESVENRQIEGASNPSIGCLQSFISLKLQSSASGPTLRAIVH